MKSTRRQFLSQTVKAGLAVLAGVLSGVALRKQPSRSGDDFWIGNPDLYEAPIDRGFTVESWVRAPGWGDEPELPDRQRVVEKASGEWVHVPLGEKHTEVFYPIGWEVPDVPNA